MVHNLKNKRRRMFRMYSENIIHIFCDTLYNKEEVCVCEGEGTGGNKIGKM